MFRIAMTGFILGLLVMMNDLSVQAAPFTLDKNIKPLELKFATVPDHPRSLWAGAKGKLGKTPDYLTVGGMTPRRIQLAMLFSKGEHDLTLNVVKNTWNESLRSCVAKANNSCEVKFSAFGDASFKITGDPEASYKFVLLAGPEQPLEAVMPSPIYHTSKKKLMRGTKEVKIRRLPQRILLLSKQL
ncbi:MAG TPA: hypothetical protein ENH43_03635 [Phycisphaerales bacterium]|nr:hypothetical protein [Phycisphaerales bacterium]